MTSPAAQSACARCGTFAQLELISGQPLCKPCVERLAATTALYSSRAVRAIAILMNPTAAVAMLAINFGKLGDKARARSWTVGAVVLGVAYLVLMQLDLPNGIYLGVNVALGLTLGRGWQPEADALHGLGFQKRNPWWVVLITFAALVAYVALYVGYLLMSGELPEG